MRTPLGKSALQVWAVEDTAVQVTWGRLDAGPVEATARPAAPPDRSTSAADGTPAGSTTSVDHPGGPGSVVVEGLSPSRTHTIEIVHPGGTEVLRATTLPSPAGRPLSRIATISDLHLGSQRWGASKLMADRSGDPTPFPYRCARAAVIEAIAWGAELLVVKGDAAHHQTQHCFDQVGDLLDEFDDLPVLLVPGNHEVDRAGTAAIPTHVGGRRVPYTRDVTHVDLPGVRVIAADTTVPGRGRGSIGRVADGIADAVSGSDRPFLLALHHQLHPHPVPTIYPIGIPNPEADRFLDRLASLEPRGVVTSGHTHRNRARRRGPLGVTEVGSTRDWPGVWAGYAIHEGGIRQVVRRAAATEAITWHEYSRRALLGLWGWWAPGDLDDRCFTLDWPESER